MKHIRLIQASGIPVVIVTYKIAENNDTLKDINVAMDFAKSTGDAAEILIQRGYRRAVYLSSCSNKVNHKFASAFQKAGIPFDSEQIISRDENIKLHLNALAGKYDIDAIFSDGGWERIEKLLKFCGKLPAEKRPALIVPKQRETIELLKRYKDMNILGYQEFKQLHLGKIATKMLVQHLKNGKKIRSILKPAYEISIAKCNNKRL